MPSSAPLLLLLALLPLVALAASPTRPLVRLPRLDVEIVPGAELHADGVTEKAVGNATSDCELCVGFMTPAVGLLSIIIAGGGAVSCPDLCHKAFNDSQTAVDVCEGLCYIVGLVAFEKLIMDGDPNPVWICEMLKVCAYNDNDNGTIVKAAAHPAVGVQGRNFTFSVEWNFSVWSGVAELNVNVSGPGGAGTFAANYYNWQAGIDYKMSIMCATKPSKGDPWTPGNYTFLFQVCEGSCSCTHKVGCKLVTQTVVPFEITPNPHTTTTANNAAASMMSSGSYVYYSSGGGGSSGDILPRVGNPTTGGRRQRPRA